MATLRSPARFNGPPESGNGGWSAGLVAGLLPDAGAVTVRLQSPPPLETDLRSEVRDDGTVAVLAGDVPVATARPLAAREPGARSLWTADLLRWCRRNQLSLSVRGVRRAAVLALVQAKVPGVQVGPSVVLGYADQGMAHLPDNQTPHRFIAARPGIGDGRAASVLAGAGIGVDAQGRPIGSLSPGQKARLGLLALRLAEPNFYLLDEPTNHVDIPGQERLEAELLAHGATEVADLRGNWGPGTGWVVLADPEGNEFCILRNAAERAAAGTTQA